MRKTLLLLMAFFATLSAHSQCVTLLDSTTAQVALPSGERLTLDFYGPMVVRLFHDPQGGPLRQPQCEPPAQILADDARQEVELTLQGNVLSTGLMEVKVDTLTGQVSLWREGRQVVAQTAPTEFASDHVGLELSQGQDDYFYGGGCQNGRFSHRGEIIKIVNDNNWVDGGVPSPCPFYWSTAGYGVMWHTFTPGQYDFGKTDASHTLLRHDTDYLDVFLMTGFGPTSLIFNYYQITGHPVLLPKFAFYQGHLNAYNRDYWAPVDSGGIVMEDGKRYKESQTDNGGIRETLNGEEGGYQFSARAVIDRYLDNDYPLGWILPNDGYATGYGQAPTLDGNIQNLKKLGDYAHSRGVEIGLWTQSDLYPKEGVEPLLQRDIVKEVRDAGVRVLKTDVAWVGAGYSFGLNGVADVAQVMPKYGHDARPFIISVDGWAGTQRHAGIWTGDQSGGQWEYIRFHIPTYIGCGLSGQPNVGSDMDGIFGGNNLAVNVRDFQWKTFTPLQLNMDGWGSNPKYPQALGEPAASINRWYLKLKSRLLPYTYTLARQAFDVTPMVRAMLLEEANAYTMGKATQYQFMYGPHFVVAPIYQPTRPDTLGNDVRDGIYLPQGEWLDYFTGHCYQGGRIINDYPAPLWKLPLLVRRGAIIPTHKSTNTPAEIDSHLRCYDLYPALGISDFVQYDDDGISTAYLRDQYVGTAVEHQLEKAGGKYRVRIYPSEGNGYDGYEPHKRTQLRIYSTEEPRKISVRVDGKKVKLVRATSYAQWLDTPNSYYYGKGDLDYMDFPALMIHMAEMNVYDRSIEVEVARMPLPSHNHLLSQQGALSAPQAAVPDHARQAYQLTPEWKAVEQADYYEIEFQGQLYSTIHQTSYTLTELQPETTYTMKVRAVNASGASQWTTVEACTKANPLEHAIHNLRGETSCDNQPGQQIEKLFDWDEGSTWHTKWGEKAVPFELVIDLRSVNQLDKLLYLPRPDAANGTLLEGHVSVSMNRQEWSEPQHFSWPRTGEPKQIHFASQPQARYIRLQVTRAVGDFGSGQQIYAFRTPGSESYIPGDINQDGRIDENDLTSYMNYTGLRQGDADFEGYISRGDLDGNGLIDARDIQAVAMELEGGASAQGAPHVAGHVHLEADKKSYKAGDEMTLTLQGTDLAGVNALSLALPYQASELEYLSTEAPALAAMHNMTRDRLHTNGQKALYPTFVHLGNKAPIEGSQTLMKVRFKVLKNGAKIPTLHHGILADRHGAVITY